MEKIELYRNYIQQVLREYVGQGSSKKDDNDEVETQLVFDTERDHYQVVHTGWKNRYPMYGCVLHLDLKGDKIWIQHDGTEIGIANELVNLGVPKEDIVLAFHEPLVRKYTGFGIG